MSQPQHVLVLGPLGSIVLHCERNASGLQHASPHLNDEYELPAGADFTYEVLALLLKQQGTLALDRGAIDPQTDAGDHQPVARATLRDFGSHGQALLRIHDFTVTPTPPGLSVRMPADVPSPSYIVLHGRPKDPEITSTLEALARSNQNSPCFILNLDGTLPSWPSQQSLADASSPSFPDHNSTVDTLLTRGHQVCAVTSIAALQRKGAAIHSDLSWEHLVEDLGAELHLFPPLRRLTAFSHLLIRVGTTGIIHLRNHNGSTKGRLYFFPDGPVVTGHERGGHVLGKSCILQVGLLETLTQLNIDPKQAHPNCSEHGRLWDASLLAALRRIRALHARGYPFSKAKTTAPAPEGVLSQMFRDLTPSDGDSAVCADIPEHILMPPSPGSLRTAARWRLLDSALQTTPFHRVNVALAIAKFGHRQVLNVSPPEGFPAHSVDKEPWATLARLEYWEPQDRAPDYLTLQEGDYPELPCEEKRVPQPIIGPLELSGPHPLPVPVARFGKLLVAERDEIETLRSIEALLRKYIDKNDPQAKPLSLAVFGPPGSGKSFAVKQLRAMIDADAKRTRLMEYNLAQFKTVEDLVAALQAVGGESHGKTPLVFFDEFDCTFEGRRLGWLQSFLAPMQDGVFYSKNQTIAIGRAVFVFAGGIFSSFEGFDPRPRIPEEVLGMRAFEEYRQRVREFSDQKGPDFISRLRGYINVLDINQESGRVKHLIRRALQLRGLLEEYQYVRGDVATVSDELLYALLTIDRYRHGIRSMGAVLQMCNEIDDEIVSASLPSQPQLNMHVDAEEFRRRVYRGRARALSPGHEWTLAKVQRRPLGGVAG